MLLGSCSAVFSHWQGQSLVYFDKNKELFKLEFPHITCVTDHAQFSNMHTILQQIHIPRKFNISNTWELNAILIPRAILQKYFLKKDTLPKNWVFQKLYF